MATSHETENTMKTNTSSMFEFATRNKVRFASSKGDLSVEQLWDVPLRSKDDFNLNNVAQRVNAQLETATKKNFVDTSKTTEQTQVELAMDVVKYVIQVRIDQEDAAAARANKRKEKELLVEALAERQKGELTDLNVRELKKRIDALEE